MNRLYEFCLKAARRVFADRRCMDKTVWESANRLDPDATSSVIYRLLSAGKPCMVARYGSTELLATCNYLGVVSLRRSVRDFVKGHQPQWWWNKTGLDNLVTCSGIFPITTESVSRYCAATIEATQDVDVLGSWMPQEQVMRPFMAGNIQMVRLLSMEPYWAQEPWTRALAGKRVVVVHPFAELIAEQYAERRERLFANPDVLPEFSLRTVRAVQSLGGQTEQGFATWREALRWMERELDSEPYDVALIGCGGYGFLLASHVKRTGHQAVHIGGALQLLFGIRGNRWNKEYSRDFDYSTLFNNAWVWPEEREKPKVWKSVEGGCYWGK